MHIQYPYLPKNKEILFVKSTHPIMLKAKEFAKNYSRDKVMPNASIIVKNNEVIGIGANGSNYHDTHECERVKLNSKSGQDYELCEGCHPKNHGEQTAILDALKKDNDTDDAELYMWGHWWCCKPCWKAMKNAGIKNVYVIKNANELFDKNNPKNIVGKQFL